MWPGDGNGSYGYLASASLRSRAAYFTSLEGETKLLELARINHTSVNSNDFTVKSKLNAYILLHSLYWPFKLLGF